jgi:hypothetical protein
MMTDILDLFTGIGIVIDDALESQEQREDPIWKITENIESKNIPLLYYYNLPEESVYKQFKNINFVLLDWELYDKPEPGMYMDTAIHIKANIDFLKKIAEVTFSPIFIFSNEPPDSIINHLVVSGIYIEGKKNNIFVKQKSDLIAEENNNLLFEEIERWVKETPSIYVLKEWEVSLNTAKNKLFWDFSKINHKWPKVLQDAFISDGSDVNHELGNFIFKNILARTKPIEFDEEILKLHDDDLTKEELRKVLEAERFLKNDSLPPMPATGDLFKVHKHELSEDGTSDKEIYFLNIRPDCDIAIRDGQTNPEIYCIECDIVNENNDFKQKFSKGTLIETSGSAYLPFVYEGKVFILRFKKLRIFKWSEMLWAKNKGGNTRLFCETRIGRVLPPYITSIQQKYSFYIQRQGLPGIPYKAIE